MSDEYRSDGFAADTPEKEPETGKNSAFAPAEETAPVTNAPAAAQTPPQQYVPGTQAPQYQQPAGGVPPVPPAPPVPPYRPAGAQGAPNGYPPVNNGQTPPYPHQAVPPQQYPQQGQYPPQGQIPPQAGYHPYQQPGRPPYPTSYTPYPVSMPEPGRGTAIASLVLGIVSIVFMASIVIPIICGIIGLVLGCTAKSRGQGGLAIAGIVLSCIGLAMGILFIVLIVVASGEYYYNYDWYTRAASMLHR